MNKEELKEYLCKNLYFERRTDISGNNYLALILDESLVTLINLEQLQEYDGV